VFFHTGVSSSLKPSGRLETTRISHSGNNMFTHLINVSSAVELPVKMSIRSTFNLVSGTGLVAFQAARRAGIDI